jgi:hypothetical protein
MKGLKIEMGRNRPSHDMELCLQDFLDARRFYRVEERSGQVLDVHDADTKKQNFSGFASYRRIGLVGPQLEFVAIYTTDITLNLRLGDQLFNFSDKQISAQRTTVPLFTRRFTVYKCQTRPSLEWRYWFLEWREWPNNGDIFWWIAEQTATMEKRLRLIYRQRATSQGRDIANTQFMEEMENWVSKRLQDTPGSAT